MITGRWGKPSKVLLDITVDDAGNVTGIANPGRDNAPITLGRFDASTGTVHLEGEHAQDDKPVPFAIDGRLDGRTLRLFFSFGERTGEIELVRVEDYVPPRPTLVQRIKPHIEDFQRWVNSLSRPRGEDNARKLKERGESLDSIVFRDATFGDLQALSELHVETWNATYNVQPGGGPTVEIRAWQWAKILGNPLNRDIVVVLENRDRKLIGFYRLTFGENEWKGQLNKIYLRWEYHGLGLGRRMMGHAARRFLERGVDNFVLFAERSNPTIGFYDKVGGERLVDDRGHFCGAYGFRDVKKLAEAFPA